MRILITGGTGFVGSALVNKLLERGDEVWVYTHRQMAAAQKALPPQVTVLTGADDFPAADALVNLAGASIAARPLTSGRARHLLESRLAVLALIAEKYRGRPLPGVFIQASATGIYRNNQECDERGLTGGGFSGMLLELEEAAMKLCAGRARLCLLRIGVVMGPGGGLMRITKRLPRLKIVGGGDNLVPWISLEDLTSALLRLLDEPEEGPVNAVSPEYRSANQLLAMGKGRLFVPLPAFLLRSPDRRGRLLLASHQVIPGKLLQLGFRFKNRWRQ